eukprot:PITA_09459
MLGELTYFLGLQVQQNKDDIFLSQTKYLKQILKKYGMEDSKPVCTPMVTGCSLSANDESAAVHQPTYKSMIGSLLYLTGTRRDIMHAVGIVGRFQANPKETHLQAIKRIFKYLQGTQGYGLWYPRGTDLTLHAYTDANWAGSVDDRKSTSGGAFFKGPRLVSWFSKKQSSIALSIAEAKYVAAASCCTQLLWMMQTLQDLQITCTPPISVFCDNTSVISISKNPVMHSNTKHISIKYHFLREQVLEKKVRLEYVPSKEQIVDILTKPLPRETFEYLRQKLGVVNASSCVESCLFQKLLYFEKLSILGGPQARDSASAEVRRLDTMQVRRTAGLTQRRCGGPQARHNGGAEVRRFDIAQVWRPAGSTQRRTI